MSLPSYDQNQMDVELMICVNCRRAVYQRRPCYEICTACRTGAPPIGPVIPHSRIAKAVCDVNGVPMFDP